MTIAYLSYKLTTDPKGSDELIMHKKDPKIKRQYKSIQVFTIHHVTKLVVDTRIMFHDI